MTPLFRKNLLKVKQHPAKQCVLVVNYFSRFMAFIWLYMLKASKVRLFKLPYFFMLVWLVSSCKAQKKTTSSLSIVNLQYYSQTCDRYADYTRNYLNDTVYVERHSDVTDTLKLIEGNLYRLHRGAVYQMIDAENDFKSVGKSYRYYYYGLSPKDTLQKDGESIVEYRLRLQQSIVIYIPVKTVTINGREMFMYNIVGDCYPASSEKCVQSKIINGQYGILYFEKGIGLAGFAAGLKCSYFLTDRSYEIIRSINTRSQSNTLPGNLKNYQRAEPFRSLVTYIQ